MKVLDRRHRWGPAIDDHAGGIIHQCRACGKTLHFGALEYALPRIYSEMIRELINKPSLLMDALR